MQFAYEAHTACDEHGYILGCVVTPGNIHDSIAFDPLYDTVTEKCAVCPYLQQCTKSKTHQKTVTKHIWSDYIELAEDYRHTQRYKEIYEKRKETIERVFADAKEKHSMRYTTLTGLAQVTKWVKLKFACMNLKKFAIHLRTGDNTCPHISIIWKISVALNRILLKIATVPKIGIGVI